MRTAVVIVSVVIVVVFVVWVVVSVVATPGQWTSPANADTASVRLRIDTANNRRKVFTLVSSNMRYKNLVSDKNFVNTLEQPRILLQGFEGRRKICAQFA